MPFRNVGTDSRKLLDLQRRTGEPSPSFCDWKYPEGHGKAHGSFTEKMRLSLWEWMKQKYGSMPHPLTFDYKLSRHKTITVIGIFPRIIHNPSWGKANKGFVLEIRVTSIDGVPVKMTLGNRTRLSWNRIVGRDRFLALPQPVRNGEPM